MCLNRTSEWKVMTIWISREPPLFNFGHLDILCAWIRHTCEKLWSFELLKSFHCSISNVSIYYAPESDIRFKSYDHWNSRELPLFNFEHLDILRAWIGHPSEKLWSFELLKSFDCSISNVSIYYAPESDIRFKSYDHLNFSRASVVQFLASQYIMCLNLTSVWKVMTIWISRELPMFNFERLDILCAYIGPPSEKLWPFEFLESLRCSISGISIYYMPESDILVKSYDHLNCSRASIVQFQTSRSIMRQNRTSDLKVMTIWILESFRCSISSVSIYYVPESDILVKSYDHLNCSRASIVQFQTSRSIMRLNRTSDLKVMTIWISRELPLFNF